MCALLALLVSACGSAMEAVEVSGDDGEQSWTTLSLENESTYALLPTTGIQNLEGEPERWTAVSGDGELLVEHDELPTGPLPQEDVRGVLDIRPISGESSVHLESKTRLENGLLSVPLSAWREATSDLDSRVNLEVMPFRLGPMGV